jgi:creatinine amidohydrolase
LVDTKAYTSSYIRKVGDKGRLVPENGGATYAWLTRDVAPTGVMGDPSPATIENGKLWREQSAQGLAELLEEMYVFRNLQPL